MIGNSAQPIKKNSVGIKKIQPVMLRPHQMDALDGSRLGAATTAIGWSHLRNGAAHVRRPIARCVRKCRLRGLDYGFALFSAATRSLASWAAFLGSDSSPFRYFSQAGWPMLNCVNPYLWFGMAFATSSCERTSGTKSCIQSGLDAAHLS